MQIRNINVKVSAVSLAVFGTFTILLFIYIGLSGDFGSLIYVPSLLLLLLIPMGLNYLSQREYQSLIPAYEKEAKPMRIKAINQSMIGDLVRIEGVVERVHFRYLNRPQFLVADKSGEISVKMFTTPAEDIRKDDIVEILGQVLKRYLVTGDPIVNAVSIRKIRKVKDT